MKQQKNTHIPFDITCNNVTFFKGNLEEELKKLNLKPFGTKRIDWDYEEIFSDYYADEDNLLVKILEFLSSKNKKDIVYLYWDNGIILDVKMEIECLTEHLDDIYNETFTFWIIDSDYQWIIEYYNHYEVVIKEY